MNRNCPGCRAPKTFFARYGRYFRRSDSRYIQRFYCKLCGCHFSAATFSDCYRQKKRRLNVPVQRLLSSAVSMRRIAKLLGVSRTTVARKLTFLAQQARNRHRRFLCRYRFTQGYFEELQFDDLLTFEHTKCKPITVTVVVDRATRLILDFNAAPIPASGSLAAIARKKYGYRPDLSRSARQTLLQRLRPWVHPQAVFSTDEHSHYPVVLRRWFPNATHLRHKSARSAITGQGELKKVVFDPLFSINHTLAMFRANVNRLVRRTWCTSKDIRRLSDHLAIYQNFHNQELLAKVA